MGFWFFYGRGPGCFFSAFLFWGLWFVVGVFFLCWGFGYCVGRGVVRLIVCCGSVCICFVGFLSCCGGGVVVFFLESVRFVGGFCVMFGFRCCVVVVFGLFFFFSFLFVFFYLAIGCMKG